MEDFVNRQENNRSGPTAKERMQAASSARVSVCRSKPSVVPPDQSLKERPRAAQNINQQYQTPSSSSMPPPPAKRSEVSHHAPAYSLRKDAFEASEYGDDNSTTTLDPQAAQDLVSDVPNQSHVREDVEEYPDSQSESGESGEENRSFAAGEYGDKSDYEDQDQKQDQEHENNGLALQQRNLRSMYGKAANMLENINSPSIFDPEDSYLNTTHSDIDQANRFGGEQTDVASSRASPTPQQAPRQNVQRRQQYEAQKQQHSEHHRSQQKTHQRQPQLPQHPPQQRHQQPQQNTRQAAVPLPGLRNEPTVQAQQQSKLAYRQNENPSAKRSQFHSADAIQTGIGNEHPIESIYQSADTNKGQPQAPKPGSHIGSLPPPPPAVQLHEATLDHDPEDLMENSFVLDYVAEKLKDKKYSELATENFDYDPNMPDTKLFPNKLTSAALPEQLQHALNNFDKPQRAFFLSTMPIAEWEEAGEWFVDQFSDAMKKIIGFRKEKRRLAAEFENDISNRDQAVARKKARIENELNSMKATGQQLLKSPRKGRSVSKA